MLSVQEFRECFPQFTAELFPDSRVAFFLTLADKRLDRKRWDIFRREGMALFAAHYLTLEREANKYADGTGGLQATAGAVTSVSKAVGGVSKSEGRSGSAASSNPAAGQWNDTIYGRQYWDLVQLVGAGGTQV